MTYVTTLALCLLLFRNFGFFGVYTGFLCSYRLRESDPANGCHGPSYITQWFCVYSLYFLCVFFIIVVHASGQHGLSTMLVAARSSAHSTWLWDGICLAIGVVAFFSSFQPERVWFLIFFLLYFRLVALREWAERAEGGTSYDCYDMTGMLTTTGCPLMSYMFDVIFFSSFLDSRASPVWRPLGFVRAPEWVPDSRSLPHFLCYFPPTTLSSIHLSMGQILYIFSHPRYGERARFTWADAPVHSLQSYIFPLLIDWIACDWGCDWGLHCIYGHYFTLVWCDHDGPRSILEHYISSFFYLRRWFNHYYLTT